jgi:hypothetical protein
MPPALLISSTAIEIPIRYMVPFGVWNPDKGMLTPILIGGLSAANATELATAPTSAIEVTAKLRLVIRHFVIVILPCHVTQDTG